MKVYSIEKADYWRKKIEEQKNSGFSMSHFCQNNNLSLDSFKYWKYRFRNADNAELTETHKSSTLSLIRESSSDNGRFLPVCIRDRSLTSVNPVFTDYITEEKAKELLNKIVNQEFSVLVQDIKTLKAELQKRDEVENRLREQLIPKSFATASLLAYIIISKFNDSLPLYRLSKMLEREGVVTKVEENARGFYVTALFGE